jgi:hypothetical protein
VLPTGLPYDTDTDPPITDTGHVCQPLVPHPGCHTEDWVLQTDGIYAQTARAVTSLPDGDLVVVGNSQADFTVAAGRADEATVTQCGINYKGFILKVGIDGTVRWARPLLDSCDYAQVTDIETTPDGRLLVWGFYTDLVATLVPGQPSAVDLPVPDRKDYWWAILDADGELQQAHTITTPGNAVFTFDDMAMAADGTVYATGQFEEEFTLSSNGPAPLHVVEQEGAHISDVEYIAAWGSDGLPKWATVEGTDMPGSVGLSFLFPDSSGVSSWGQPGGEILWGTCTEYEVSVNLSVGLTLPRPSYQGLAHYNRTTGVVDRAIHHQQAPLLTNVQGRADGTYLVSASVNGRWTYFGRDFGPNYDPFLYLADSLGTPLSPIVKTTLDWEKAPGATAIDSDDFWVLAAGPALSSATEWEWRCGEPIAKQALINPSDSSASWSTFTLDMEPVCGGYLGLTTIDSFGAMDAVLDEEGGIVVVTSFRDSLTLWEGLPEEQTFTADGTDVLIVRLAPP